MLIPLLIPAWLGLAGSTTATADPTVGGAAGDDAFVIVGEEANGGSPTGGTTAPSGGGNTYRAYRWASICQPNPEGSPAQLECSASLTCPDPVQRRWQLWGQTQQGQWVTVTTQCMGGTPPEVALPTVTPGDVLNALRRVGLPELETFVQPEDKTLVNFDTIFYTESEPVSVDLTILGQAVDVVATPSRYQWVFGDGTSATTDVPGAPYPSKAVTHRYADAQVTVAPHVEVTYSARFRVNGGGWQDIDGTVTTVGPPTTVRVAEATGVLSGAHG